MAVKKGAVELVRAMTYDDLPQVVKIARRAYDEDISVISERPGLEPWADSVKGREDTRITSQDLAEHILRHDAGTCLVAEDDGKVNGAMMAINREGMIIMSMLAVRPKAQGRGYAAAIIDRMRAMLDDYRRAMAVVKASETIRAMFPWNFDVHPAMRAGGQIDRSRLSTTKSVREGTPQDRDFIEGLDRRLRGASRGVDHDLLASRARLFVAEERSARGYAYAHSDGSPLTLAATTTTVARELLTSCLASGSPGDAPVVRNLTGEQRWAFDVVRSLGMDLHLAGPVIVRGMALPAPYLPHDSLG
ncbi:GNAT family N-acetyltransferase [Epidermidibacterium keratini]|uniref:GNAT family N-acetyltransferase n=1 Tax=Epidermidibacterium keratini TaxID=1891644 RepID=A0A7L4YK04_9ACTN|nr:GNAT family N-acetyltransferase [Epidermidibacterium keratini]QHB99212.1 GNAT family N-acetyltransferase [Epidermidibacterium keratini]